MRPSLRLGGSFWVTLILIVAALDCPWPSAAAAVTREEVERAIREGVRFLKNSSVTTAPGPTSKTTPGRASPAW